MPCSGLPICLHISHSLQVQRRLKGSIALSYSIHILHLAMLTPVRLSHLSYSPQVQRRLKGSIASKINGYEDLLAPLVAQACIDVCPKNPTNFNVDNVRG